LEENPGAPVIRMRNGDPISIVGAGPAGLAAAITIARAGRKAVVYERQPGVGTRFHGDFQGIENWTSDLDALEELDSIGIRPSFDVAVFREGVFFDSWGREHLVRAQAPPFYLVRRGDEPGTLDCALRDQALAAGAEIRFGAECRALPDGGIVASGPRGCDAVDVGYVFETEMSDGIFGVFSDRIAPKGYAYLIVHRGRGTVAACLFSELKRGAECRDRAVEFFRERAGLRMRNAREFGGTGNIRLPRSACEGGILRVGEAAGFQDALWGFGIRYAVLSGHLAARALLRGRPGDYDDLWRARLRAFLRASVANRRIYSRIGNRGYALILRWLEGPRDARRKLQRLYAPSVLKTLFGRLLPPS
jgi:flavin-dependent dehydrogenase